MELLGIFDLYQLTLNLMIIHKKVTDLVIVATHKKSFKCQNMDYHRIKSVDHIQFYFTLQSIYS